MSALQSCLRPRAACPSFFGPHGTRTLGGYVTRYRWLLARQEIERHDLARRDVLLHVAVEDPGARVVDLETDHGPAAAPQRDHVLLQRPLDPRLVVARRVVGAAPVGVVWELGAGVALDGIVA